jgi:hypothetical protein
METEVLVHVDIGGVPRLVGRLWMAPGFCAGCA